MRFICRYGVVLCCLFLFACQKSEVTTSKDAVLLFSSLNLTSDTLHFDTLFTQAGSTTQIVKIFNLNAQKLRLDNLRLYGGSNSAYQINLNGVSGTQFSNIEIAAGDSIYLFVKVLIDPTVASTPFVVQDSIGIDYNGKNEKIHLEAFGQNAIYLQNANITKDTTWASALPIVLQGKTTINENATLTIAAGSHIYSHADAVLRVNGKVIMAGTPDKRIQFTNDRLDGTYNTLAGSWSGISFGPNSYANELNYVTINNAVAAIADTNDVAPIGEKLSLAGCIISNASANGLLLRRSNVTMQNSLISNCGQNISITYGGMYHFYFNTLVGYSNSYVYHQSPTVQINNYNSDNQTAALTAVFSNCIIWGSLTQTSELSLDKKGNDAWDASFENGIIATVPSNITFAAVLNQDPLFALVYNERAQYDFHLSANSPAKKSGVAIAGITTDLEGTQRSSTPSIGCYE